MPRGMVSPPMRRLLSAVVLFFLIAAAAAAQVSEVIEVRVVEVEVVVVDGHGQPVRGLTREDFELRQGGKPRQINRVLVALRRFVEANVKEGVDASLVTYDHDAKVRVPFTDDRARIVAA